MLIDMDLVLISQVLVAGVSLGCVYGLIALGFVLIYKATEVINFAQGDLMMIGMFIAFTFLNVLEMPYWLGLVCTCASMALIGMLLERSLLRPMIGEPAFAVLMLTVGLGFVLRAIAGGVWGVEPKNLHNPFSGNVLSLGEVIMGYENLAMILGTALLCAALGLYFRHTRIGVSMQAASQNQLAAVLVGISVNRVTSLAWALSAGIAGFAGVLLAPVSLFDPQVGFIGIKAFAAAIIGGLGSLSGAMIAGIAIGVIEQFAQIALPTSIATSSPYLLMLIMLVLRPGGLFASIQRKKV